jgi:hypothetical protein
MASSEVCDHFTGQVGQRGGAGGIPADAEQHLCKSSLKQTFGANTCICNSAAVTSLAYYTNNGHLRQVAVLTDILSLKCVLPAAVHMPMTA